jgi:ubiquinone/menaquinone biosynthesis C-methylase UbiE
MFHKLPFSIIPAPIRKVASSLKQLHKRHEPGEQDLEIYWDPKMAQVLDTWGEGNVWDEVQMLFLNSKGRVLDIACGTGKTIEILSRFKSLDIYGCDISDVMIRKALERGINADRLIVADATKLNYPEGNFDFSFSIGSLEHFTLQGIDQVITQARRVTKRGSFHMVPVSRSNRNEGWMKTLQSFHNNSVSWWIDRFRIQYPKVFALNSKWNDNISLGKWFICQP